MILHFEEKRMTDGTLEKRMMGWAIQEGAEFVEGEEGTFSLDDESRETPGQQFRACLMAWLLEERHLQI